MRSCASHLLPRLIASPYGRLPTLRRRGPHEWKAEPEGGAHSYHTLDADTAAWMQLDQLLADMQTHAQAPTGLAAPTLDLDSRRAMKRLPYPNLFLGRQPRSMILHTHYRQV